MEIGNDTKFEGKGQGLKDVKPGDTVTLRWVRQEQGDQAISVAAR